MTSQISTRFFVIIAIGCASLIVGLSNFKLNLTTCQDTIEYMKTDIFQTCPPDQRANYFTDEQGKRIIICRCFSEIDEINQTMENHSQHQENWFSHPVEKLIDL